MTTDVAREGEVSLNNLRYPLAKDPRSGEFIPVSTTPGQRYAQKFVLGDFGTESRERVSVIRWDDFRGGALLERFNGETENLNRCFTSQIINIRHFHSIVLAANLVSTGSVPDATCTTLTELNKEVYGTFGTAVHKYNNGTDTWASSLRTLAAAATDAITAVIGGTENIVIATTSDYDYSTDGSSWNRSTKNAIKLAVWDDKLWGIDATGQLWFTNTVGSGETNDAQLPLVPALTGEDAVGALFVGPDAAGEPILYATCRAGLFAHDAANQRWIQTGVIPAHGTTLGTAAITWHKRIYVAIGASLIEYDPVGGTVRDVGLNQDSGLDSAYGHIRSLAASYNEIFVTTGSSALSFGAVFAWNGVGWYNPTGSADEHFALLVSSSYDSYRLWWSSATGASTVVFYTQLQSIVSNPKNDATYAYYSLGTLETPWLEIGPDVDGLALRVKVETDDCDADETVKVEYRVNDAALYTTLGTITTDGVTTYELPSSATPTGVACRNIQFKITLARGSTATNSPVLESLSLEFVRRLPIRYSHQFVVDVSKPYNDRNPIQMIKDLRDAFESTVKVPFSWRDSGQDADGEFLSYVEVVGMEGLETTGHKWSGQVTMLVSDS